MPFSYGEMEKGGAIPTGVQTVVTAEFTENDYGGTVDPPVVCLRLMLEKDGKSSRQDYSVGKVERTLDGCNLKGNPTQGSNFGWFMRSLENCGPEAQEFVKMMSDAGNIRLMDGIVLDFETQEIDRGEFGVKQLPCPVAVIKYPTGGGSKRVIAPDLEDDPPPWTNEVSRADIEEILTHLPQPRFTIGDVCDTADVMGHDGAAVRRYLESETGAMVLTLNNLKREGTDGIVRVD